MVVNLPLYVKKLPCRCLEKSHTNRVFSLINIVGLAIGLRECALIYQYVRFEESYDRFHAKADRIFRVALANKHRVGSEAFVILPLFLLLISAGTITFICMKAVVANPTTSLRHE